MLVYQCGGHIHFLIYHLHTLPFGVDAEKMQNLNYMINIYGYLGILLQGRERFEDEALNEMKKNDNSGPAFVTTKDAGDAITLLQSIAGLKHFTVSTNGDELYIGVSEDVEVNSLRDLQYQILWLNNELCTMLEEKRSTTLRQVPVVSTGSFALDIALGVGGFPKGRVVEIYGPEASGKTTFALDVITEARKQGGYCVFVDAGHALDPSLAEAIGVNFRDLLLSQPDCGE
ncbi:hypothetical protein L1887_10544 [Cichorium endivia]|nr:hypothetical protein L1887_10544 [Cichorium endivia]